MSISLQHPVPGAPRGSRYGPRSPILINGVWTRPMHSGQDFPAPAGTPILAAADGTVGYAGWVTTGGGNWTRIDHSGNWKTHYGHQSRIAVRAGQRVKAGQVIGYVGTTGSSTGNHLHFELSLGTVRRDPWPYIKTSTGGGSSGGGSKPAPLPTTEETDMSKNIGMYIGTKRASSPHKESCVIFNPESGFYTTWSGVSQSYHNGMAHQFKTGSFKRITNKHWNQMKNQLDALRASN